jgi:hypothetical protein
MTNDLHKLDNIKCPNCGQQIPVSDAIYHQIADQTREQFKTESLEQQKKLATKERDLANKEKAIDQTIKEQLASARSGLIKEAEATARQSVGVEIEDLKRKAAEKDQQLELAQKAELELRKQKRSLEEREKNLELETARKMDEERKKIQEETEKRLQDAHRLKDAEKDKKIQDATRVNDELRRKLEQGSQQTQGEVLELELEQLISNAFPSDRIEPVPKGVSGADTLQRVIHSTGHPCGSIVWESKRTKAWSDGWIAKLKDDQRTIKANIAILVSETLPKDCKNFQQINGVWVSNPQCALPLAIALRSQLIEVEMAKLSAVGKNEKMEVMYRYVSGPEFKQRVEAIVEAFVDMQNDLQEERRSAERRWAKRDKQIQKVISNTGGMYGDLQGLIGSSLQSIPLLTSGDSDEEPVSE